MGPLRQKDCQASTGRRRGLRCHSSACLMAPEVASRSNGLVTEPTMPGRRVNATSAVTECHGRSVSGQNLYGVVGRGRRPEPTAQTFHPLPRRKRMPSSTTSTMCRCSVWNPQPLLPIVRSKRTTVCHQPRLRTDRVSRQKKGARPSRARPLGTLTNRRRLGAGLLHLAHLLRLVAQGVRFLQQLLLPGGILLQVGLKPEQ